MTTTPGLLLHLSPRRGCKQRPLELSTETLLTGQERRNQSPRNVMTSLIHKTGKQQRQAYSLLTWPSLSCRVKREILAASATTMCYGKCARCIGHSLVWLAILCIVANILLYFPNGETKYASENHLSRFVWFFSGIVGGGLLMFLPAFVFIGLEQDDCCGCCGHENCGKRCAMLSSVLAALIGIAGSGYCVIVAALGLAEGPVCRDSFGQWNYTFANTDGQYLLDTSTWSQCTEPKHIVEWNVSLFSILLALGGIEFILCLIQVINGVMGGICGYCCSRQQRYDC
uniref:Transmembrane 4 L six family member 1 n=2 Tax=Felis catus TaxID=9685 RepID=A0ABI7XZE3_FELCA